MGFKNADEIAEGSRFAFGENWISFLNSLDKNRICQAEQSLCNMLKVKELREKRFLDIGSGSGLFSLAARNLGASVYSFDYDSQSVACTKELKRQYYPNDPDWQVEHGSVLDVGYLDTLGQWDIVYSWGALHHTGDLLQALTNITKLVSKGGSIFLAIYNDQGRTSELWLRVKKLYNRLPRSFRGLVLWPSVIRLWGPTVIRDILVGRPFQTWHNYSETSLRGMSPWHDVLDWVGGLPFEVAKPEHVFRIYRDCGFRLEELNTCAGGHGCNEFVFRKEC